MDRVHGASGRATGAALMAGNCNGTKTNAHDLMPNTPMLNMDATEWILLTQFSLLATVRPVLQERLTLHCSPSCGAGSSQRLGSAA